MRQLLIILFIPAFYMASFFCVASDLKLNQRKGAESEIFQFELIRDHNQYLISPPEGLWSIANEWKESWPSNWFHANPNKVEHIGEWTIISGELLLPEGKWNIKDSCRPMLETIRCQRRWQWLGDKPLKNVTLSVRWLLPTKRVKPLFPGLLYSGNPSGYKNGASNVPYLLGQSGEKLFLEEHRFPMPFISAEWQGNEQIFASALHVTPSKVPYANKRDQWWSLGLAQHDDNVELALLSGATAINGSVGKIKTGQHELSRYDNAFLTVIPGAIIEKEYFLEAVSGEVEGQAMLMPVHTSLAIFKPTLTNDLPKYKDIFLAKFNKGLSRWFENENYAGFNKYEFDYKKLITLGWTGQAAAMPRVLLSLPQTNKDPKYLAMVQKSLDFITTSPINGKGYMVDFDPITKQWSKQEDVKQAQGLLNIITALKIGQNNSLINTEKWHTFTYKVLQVHTQRILQDNWSPESTSEAFYIAPLVNGYELYSEPKFKQAAIKVATHFRQRHQDMSEPYWGGTLDANGEDKEGAWAAFQGFMALYALTKDNEHLIWAQHAADVLLSYVVVWDIEMPPGRLEDNNFKSRGWTAVSPQNQHIDVYGVITAPLLYKLGMITNNTQLTELAKLMYLSCGQLIDSNGSHGEQVQQTNYSQAQKSLDSYQHFRGGYVESWTVFWLTTHFLVAASEFEKLGVKL